MVEGSGYWQRNKRKEDRFVFVRKGGGYEIWSKKDEDQNIEIEIMDSLKGLD